MRTVFRTGLLAPILALALLAATATAGLACNKNFVVYNHSDQTITKFYVSPHQKDDWEDNVLSDSIEPDTHTRVDMSDDTREYSIYDVKAIFEDGSKSIGGKINLCRAQSIYIYADHVTFDDGN